jgi:hypothetical protein
LAACSYRAVNSSHAEYRRQCFHMQDDVEVFGGSKLQPGPSIVKIAAVPPTRTY